MKDKKKPYENLDLEPMEGEIFESIPEYDGYYEASNLGRIKSCYRLLDNGQIVRERIMKQNRGAYLQVTLSMNNKKKTYNVHWLVYVSFRGHYEYGVVNHLDKVKYNNVLTNLCLLNWTQTALINYEKGVKQNCGIDRFPKEKKRELDFYLCPRDGFQICIKCEMEKPLSDFYFKKETGLFRRECKACALIRDGVAEVGKLTHRKELFTAGYRVCSVCKETKPISDFAKNKRGAYGLHSNCRKCACEMKARYDARRKSITP